MKKRIVLGLAVFTSIFVLGGIYLIVTIEETTSSLKNLIELHQVAHLREQLLFFARETQSDLALQHTQFAGTLEAMVKNVTKLENQANKCLGCHHTAAINAKLQDLKGQIVAYDQALVRFLTVRTDATRRKEEEKQTFEAGHKLIYLLDEMISLTKGRLEKRTQDTLIKISGMKNLIFIVIALGPIIAVGLAIIIMRGLTGPLSVLLQATRKLKSGELGFRVQGLTGEFGEMAAAFNEMAAALNVQMHKMQRAEQLTIVGEIAASLAHEIKNPLAGIKGAIQIFQAGADITEEEHAVLSQVIGEVQRVETLLKSLLNFARPPQPQFLPVNMNDILNDSFKPSLPYSLAALNSPQDVRIVKEFDPQLPLVMADPMEMQQVFLNLLMNALQAMPAGGTLTVSTGHNPAAQEIQVEIADTGKGIKDEIREKIFQPFFTTKSKGTGLGLAICKQFIEMHGGTIVAEQNPGGGSIFRINLPCTQRE